ncbi:hypothetical protein F5882DRAFT_311321, partial [Hyaloscypha sp. PMI_1271]
FNYSLAYDINTVLPRAKTSGIIRPQLGSVLYRTRINDNSLYLYIKDFLNILDKYNSKVTFFISNNNLGKRQIDNYSIGYPIII